MEKFIRVSNGVVYRYSEKLMKRRDALVVDGQAAADYFRSIGVENDITKKYPESELTRGVPEPRATKTTRRVPKKETSGAKTATVVSDDKDPDALQELIGNAEKLLHYNYHGNHSQGNFWTRHQRSSI